MPTCRPAGDAAIAASGDATADLLGAWQLVRHYRDHRIVELHADGTADVWLGALGSPTVHEDAEWSVTRQSARESLLRIDGTAPTELRLALGPAADGQTWRAPDEYLFRPCAPLGA